MNKLFVCLVILVLHTSLCSATIHTLCNMPYSPGMFTTYADADAAASDGDTIYVHGSTISYGDIFVTKSLVIIGTGHHPNKQNALVSSFETINVMAPFVQVIGVTFKYLNSNEHNNTIKKCRIVGANMGFVAAVMPLNGGDGWLIEGNIFDLTLSFENAIQFFGLSAAGAIIRNNIFSSGRHKIVGIANIGMQKTYIFNNVFLGNNANLTFQNVQGAVIDNNIFVASSPDGGALSSSEMNNNISYSCSDNSFSQPGFDNLVDVNPEFVNFPGPGTFFSYNYDFRLENTSPGHNSGMDGTDKGVFGGVGFKFSTTGEPSIASVTAFTITSPTTIAPNGTLNISITSKRIH